MARLKGSKTDPAILAVIRMGSGPWKILDDCEAPQHNTVSAAVGDARRTGSHISCVCPRATELRAERDNANRKRKKAATISKFGLAPGASRSAIQLAARRAKNPLLDIGYGPWAIEPECKALQHNTLRAARGHLNVDGIYSREKCICVRAQALKKEYQAGQNLRARMIAAGQEVEDRRSTGLRQPMTGQPGPRVAGFATVLAGMPDLSAGVCVGDEQAQLVFDAASSSLDDDGSKIERAKAICSMCPLATRQACADWALKGERTPGDWGGVYGGLSPRDRIQLRYGFSRVGAA